MKRVAFPFLVTGILLLGGCGNGGNDHFSGSGTIEATEITVSTRTSGEIVMLDFEEGDTIERGNLLARIDTEQLEIQKEVTAAGLEELDWNEKVLRREMAAAEETVGQAAISLENVEKNRSRIAALLKEAAATQEQMDKIDTEYELAVSRVTAAKKQIDIIRSRLGSLDAARKKIDASLRLIEKQIADATIVCPADGVIIEKSVERGEIITYGAPVCTVADLKTVWLNIYVDEEDVGKITMGGPAAVSVDSHPGKTFDGIVTWVSPKAEFTPKNVQTRESRADLVYAVKITIENPDGVFKIGMPADAYIEGLE